MLRRLAVATVTLALVGLPPLSATAEEPTTLRLDGAIVEVAAEP